MDECRSETDWQPKDAFALLYHLCVAGLLDGWMGSRVGRQVGGTEANPEPAKLAVHLKMRRDQQRHQPFAGEVVRHVQPAPQPRQVPQRRAPPQQPDVAIAVLPPLGWEGLVSAGGSARPRSPTSKSHSLPGSRVPGTWIGNPRS